MLIERMQTHPEDFGDGGKLRRLVGRFGAEEDEYSARDEKAINAAYEAIKETRLMVSVLEALMAQPEGTQEPEKLKYKAQGRYAFGATDPQAYGSPVKNEGQPVFDPVTDTYITASQKRITREMYEDHIQTHKSPIQKHIQAVRAEKESIAAQIYNKTFGRQRIERDN